MDTRLTRTTAALAVVALLIASTPLLAAPTSGAETFVSSVGTHLDQLWTGAFDLFAKWDGPMDPDGSAIDGDDPSDGDSTSGHGTMDPDGQPAPDPGAGG